MHARYNLHMHATDIHSCRNSLMNWLTSSGASCCTQWLQSAMCLQRKMRDREKRKRGRDWGGGDGGGGGRGGGGDRRVRERIRMKK